MRIFRSLQVQETCFHIAIAARAYSKMITEQFTVYIALILITKYEKGVTGLFCWIFEAEPLQYLKFVSEYTKPYLFFKILTVAKEVSILVSHKWVEIKSMPSPLGTNEFLKLLVNVWWHHFMDKNNHISFISFTSNIPLSTSPGRPVRPQRKLVKLLLPVKNLCQYE